MTNSEVQQAFNEVWGWWKKYRDIQPVQETLDKMAQEGYEIIRKYRAAELVTHMINDMERILERR